MDKATYIMTMGRTLLSKRTTKINSLISIFELDGWLKTVICENQYSATGRLIKEILD